MQRADLYVDVVDEVDAFLRRKVDEAVARGLRRSAVIVDPGPDFTKTPHQTLQLLRGLDRIRAIGRGRTDLDSNYEGQRRGVDS